MTSSKAPGAAAPPLADPIDDTIADSFPASDPPFWSVGLAAEGPGADAPKQVVVRLFDAFRRGDLEALMATLGEDVTWTYIGANPRPVHAVLAGPERVRRFFEGIWRRLEIARFDVAELFVVGNTVIVFGSESGTVRESGEPFHDEWVQKYVVARGRVRRFVEYNVQVPQRTRRS